MENILRCTEFSLLSVFNHSESIPVILSFRSLSNKHGNHEIRSAFRSPLILLINPLKLIVYANGVKIHNTFVMLMIFMCYVIEVV